MMTNTHLVSFNALPVGSIFYVEGMPYRKVSGSRCREGVTGPVLRVSRNVAVRVASPIPVVGLSGDSWSSVSAPVPADLAAASKLGAEVVRYLRAHNRKPFGDRGVEIIVRTARAAAHAAMAH